MSAHNNLGRQGEEAACRYLASREYHLLHRNWRNGHLEVDIIADLYGEIVFFEVKTRTDESYMPAIDSVSLEKRINLIQAAKGYMAYYHLDQPYRFDIITVVGITPPFQISHYPNAFTPEGVREEILQKRRHGH